MADQPRAFGYRLNFIETTGTAAEEIEDLHHVAPLFLGGDHTVGNLVNVDETAHDELHALFEQLVFENDIMMASHNMQNMSASFSPGVAAMSKDGVVESSTLAELKTSAP